MMFKFGNFVIVKTGFWEGLKGVCRDEDTKNIYVELLGGMSTWIPKANLELLEITTEEENARTSI